MTGHELSNDEREWFLDIAEKELDRMGYAVMITPCLRCGRIFGCNPNRVPSMRLTPGGDKQPICEDCFEVLNRQRVKLGLEPWPPPLAGAYEPVDEHEL